MTRISHDLAGICGALYNTAELLEIDETFATDAGPLVKSSATALISRLKFFRALFGLDGAPLNNDVAEKYLQTLSAPFELIGEVKTRSQLAAILICADMMIRGGKIEVEENKVSGCGHTKISEQLPLALKGQIDGMDPKMAPAIWLYMNTKKNNSMVSLNVFESGLDIGF